MQVARKYTPWFARFPEESQGYCLGLPWRRMRPSHNSFASAGFWRIHVFVLAFAAWCRSVHHHFRSINMTFRAQDGDRTSLQLGRWMLSGLRWWKNALILEFWAERGFHSLFQSVPTLYARHIIRGLHISSHLTVMITLREGHFYPHADMETETQQAYNQYFDWLS